MRVPWVSDTKKQPELLHTADCYALNVSSSGVWSHYYTGFPIALIDSNWRVRCWNTDFSGGRTFAVGDDKVLLYGGFGERRTACNLLSLDDRDARLVAEVSLVLAREIDLTKDTVMGGTKGFTFSSVTTGMCFRLIHSIEIFFAGARSRSGACVAGEVPKNHLFVGSELHKSCTYRISSYLRAAGRKGFWATRLGGLGLFSNI